MTSPGLRSTRILLRFERCEDIDEAPGFDHRAWSPIEPGRLSGLEDRY